MSDPARIKDIFFEADEIADPAARDTYLVQACGNDVALRSTVAKLLDAHRNADARFMQHSPAVPDSGDLNATFIAETLPPAEHGKCGAQSRLGICIDGYELLTVLGEGGMGSVYRARQSSPIRRDVALKVVKEGMASAQVVARFEAERQALAVMDHPGIAKVFDAGTTSKGQPYFVMELVAGPTLTAYCDERRLTVPARLNLLVDVCRAIQHAHGKGVIHRDIKPTNILVTIVDGKPVPKVIDFGIAKAIGEKLGAETMNTNAAAIIGTLDYMSPEQAGLGGGGVDTRTDVYALGVVLYELLTGSTPFGGGALRRAALLEALSIIREQEPLKPSTRLLTLSREAQLEPREPADAPITKERDVRGELDWITLKALDKDPARRYQTADAMALDIERHLLGEPVSASPDSGVYRFRKFIGRNRALSGSIVAVLAALVLGLCAALWQADRATTAEKNYKHQRDAAVILQREAVDARAVSERTLADLKRTAPIFYAQAKIVLEEGKLEDALDKIGYAIQLDDANADYHLFRAHLLQSAQDLATAAEGYRRVLALRPADASAKLNLAFCEKLLRETGGAALGLDQQRQLLAALRREKRLVESAPLAALIDPDADAAKAAILARLREARAQPSWRQNTLIDLPDGTFQLNLGGFAPLDLSVLKDLPVSVLILDGSSITDLSSLAGLPLKNLALHGTKATDLSPLSGMKLQRLNVSGSHVSDLGPLEGMPLASLDCDRCRQISDLSPLRGAPLVDLHLGNTAVASLAPLAGAPLQHLELMGSKVTDFTVLSQCASLEELMLQNLPLSDLTPLAKLHLTYLNCSNTYITNIAPLRGQPLRFLNLAKTGVTDLSPLAGCNTLESIVLPDATGDLSMLRKLPRLRLISTHAVGKGTGIRPTQTAEEFWKEYDAKQKKN